MNTTERVAQIKSTYEIYMSPNHPLHLVVKSKSDGDFWFVPAVNNGWSLKKPYRGSTSHLGRMREWPFLAVFDV